MTLIWFVVGFFVVGFALVIMLTASHNKKLENNLSNLKADGFQDDQIMKGKESHVVFDLSNQVVAFIYTDRVKKVDFEEIVGWNHTYVEKNRTVNGRHRHTIEDNAIEFTLNNIDDPLIKVPVHGYNYGKEWMARVSAILKA